jgi:hypothetical protein
MLIIIKNLEHILVLGGHGSLEVAHILFRFVLLLFDCITFV